MNPETNDPFWQRISAALFGIRRTTDERIFTAAVMSEIRGRQPVDFSWRIFARWALPALALSMGGFAFALRDAMQPDPVSVETLILGDAEPSLTEEWLAVTPEPAAEEPVEVNV